MWQSWQAAQQNLTRKRELKGRYEAARKVDKIAQVRDELTVVGSYNYLVTSELLLKFDKFVRLFHF